MVFMALLRSLPTTCELPRQHPCRCLAMGVGGEILAPSQRETLRCGSPRAQAQLPTPRIAPRCLTSGHSLRPVGRRSVPRFAGAFASWLNGSKKWYRSAGCSALGCWRHSALPQSYCNTRGMLSVNSAMIPSNCASHPPRPSDTSRASCRPAFRADNRSCIHIFLAGAEVSGCSPTTPNPRTSWMREFASVMIQCREIGCAATVPTFSMVIVAGENKALESGSDWSAMN